MLQNIALAEIKTYLRQNINQEQMQQYVRKQHGKRIEAYMIERADTDSEASEL